MPANTEAISGIAGGLNASMGNLMGYAREQRAINAPENQYRQAVSAEALKQMQEDQQKIPREQLTKTNPYAGQMIDAAKNAGLIVGDEQEFTRGKIKETQAYFNKNPKVMLQILNQSHQESVKQIGDIDVAISKEQEKLKPLMDNPVGNADKIKGIQEKIAGFENQKAPLMKQRMDSSNATDYYKMIDSAQTVEQLPPTLKPYGMKLLEQGQQVTMDKVIEMHNADKANTAKNKQPYVDPQGNIVLVDTSSPDAQKLIDEKKLKPHTEKIAEMRATTFGSTATNTPGVFYDRVNKKYFTNEPAADGSIQKRELTSAEVQQMNLAYSRDKKLINTANSPNFKRIVNNGEILVDGVKDPRTGKMSEPELDKIVRLRNEVDDGAFGTLSNKVRQFNSWDQFVKYQVSDPKMAALKSAVIANAERLGAMYSGGGTVTSDKKLQLAQELLDYKLSREAFKSLVDMHKDSIINTVNKYKEDAGVGTTSPTAPAPSGAPKQTMTESEARKRLLEEGKVKDKKEQDKWIKKYKDAGLITSQAGGIRLAANDKSPENVPMGSGEASKTQDIMTLQKQYQKALLEDDFEKAEQIKKQMQELAKQTGLTG